MDKRKNKDDDDDDGFNVAMVEDALSGILSRCRWVNILV